MIKENSDKNIENLNIKQIKRQVQTPSGTVPGLIYFPLTSPQQISYLTNIQKMITSQLPIHQIPQQFLSIIPSQNFHISLSVSFRVLIPEVKSFVPKLRTALAANRNLCIPLAFKKQPIILDGRFVCLQVQEISKIKIRNDVLAKIDRFMIKWGLQKYYQNPIIHVSLFKICEGTKEDADKISHYQQNCKQLGENQQFECQKAQNMEKIAKLFASLSQINEGSQKGRKCFSIKEINAKIGNNIYKI